MSGGVVRAWGETPDHLVVVLGRGDVGGAACSCGNWQAYLSSPEAAVDARRSFRRHAGLPEEDAPQPRASLPPG